MKRRLLQFSLRGLLRLVVLVCLSLGGWHLLKTYGQSVRAEPAVAVVGQRVKIHGRFLRFFKPVFDKGVYRYELDIFPVKEGGIGMGVNGSTRTAGFLMVETENDFTPQQAGEFTLDLRADVGPPIHGKLIVRPDK